MIQPLKKTWDLIESIRRQRAQSVIIPESLPVYQESLQERIEKTEKASCGVGVDGVDIDPYGNVLACLHLQETAGNLHQNSIKDIWANSPLFTKARNRAVSAAKDFGEIPVQQFGAPLYCLAVEENVKKKFDTPSNQT